MTQNQSLNLTLHITAGADADDYEINRLTRNLLRELRRTDIERAEIPRSDEPPPDFTKGDPITIGTIVVELAPAIITGVFALTRDWMNRQQNKTLKITINGNKLEIPRNASQEQIDRIIASLENEDSVEQLQPATLREKDAD